MSIVSGTQTDHRLGFADLTEEVRVDALPVEGELPAWLHGGLVRVTPAQADFARRSVEKRLRLYCASGGAARPTRTVTRPRLCALVIFSVPAVTRGIARSP